MWVSVVVAPVLFAELDSRALAGTVAGSLFSIMSFIGLACGSMLLVLGWLQRYEPHAARWRMVLILVMLLLVVAGEFVLAPMIAELRQQGLTESARFGQVHGLASVLFVMNSVFGLVLVVVRPESS